MTFDNIPIVRVTETANGDYLTSSTRFFDFQKDKLLGSRTKRRYTTTHELDLISSGFSAGDCFDNWTYQKRSGTSVDYSEEVINYDLLANGGVVGSVFSQERILIGQFDSPSFPNNYSVDYEYEGYLANASTVTFMPLGPTPLPLTGRRLLQAFTGNLNEAITFDLKPVMGQFVYQIDGKIIPSVSGALPAYVADASPIGELFFATSDLNFIIHKPRANGIQVWQKPDSVVRLMAAIWL